VSLAIILAPESHRGTGRGGFIGLDCQNEILQLEAIKNKRVADVVKCCRPPSMVLLNTLARTVRLCMLGPLRFVFFYLHFNSVTVTTSPINSSTLRITDAVTNTKDRQTD